jgi:opacity protein-like surface antigen
MNGRKWGAIAAVAAVVSLSAEVSAAGEPGFYVGATASRVEYDLDRNTTVTPPINTFLPPPTFVLPPTGGFFPMPPVTAIIIGGTANFVALRPDEVQVDDVDGGWSATLGYRINRYVAAEVTYADFGEASVDQRYRFATIPELPPFPDLTLDATVSVSGPSVAVLGSLPLGERWELFLRGGVLFADQEIKTRSAVGSSTAAFAREFSDEVLTAAAGVQWAFAPRWTARLEYQRTDDLEAGDLNAENRIDAASLSVLFNL